MIFLVGSVSASQYFTVSNTLKDEIDVISDNSRVPLQLGYVAGEELGGENKRITTGGWENFEVKLTNNSSKFAEPWENVLIHARFYGVRNEDISGGYKQGEIWENSPVNDLRALESGGIGGFIDFGPTKGWTVESQSEKIFELRVKFETPAQDIQVEIEAITRDELKNNTGGIGDPNSVVILDPSQATYISRSDQSSNYGGEEHLEIATQENANSYTLLKFDSRNIPDHANGVELNLYQYWGSGFSDLRNSEVQIQVFPISGDWNENDINWESRPDHGNSPIAEENILETGDWYSFDISEYLYNLENEKDLTLLLKFSRDNFDEKKGTIRNEAIVRFSL